MQTTLALVAALASVASALPQASAPAGCSASYPGTFEFTTYKAGSAKREVTKRQGSGYTLQNNVFKDSQGRSAEIVANHQFQFDPTPQAGYISTGPWSVCSNGSIALGHSTYFYQCEKEPNVYDIYDRTLDPTTLAGCEPITIDVMGSSGSAPVSQATDGQAVAPTATASQLSDGQPQAATASQLTDGQVQAPTAASQLTDGQIQVATPAPPAPSATQLSDGQPQVSSASSKASQLSDGQPQVPSATAKASQLSDGQPQVPSATSKGATATQLPDGQPQVGNATTPVPFTGAGNVIATGSSFAAALFVAIAAFL